MKIRVEFTRSKSSSYSMAVRFCKRLPTYEEIDDAGVLVHAVEFASQDRGTWAALMSLMGNWKGAAYYLDGKPTTALEIWNMPYTQKEEGGPIYDPKEWTPTVIDVEAVQEKPRRLPKRG